MAGFVGTKWATRQLRLLLKSDKLEILSKDEPVPSISRSVHYGLFLAFEGIRYFVKEQPGGKLEITFLNLYKNLERLRRSVSFNLGSTQQDLVPARERLMESFSVYFSNPEMRDFLKNMALQEAQGYLRPFTFDESVSIGVTFPEEPSIRAVTCSYEGYLGEPFSGVVIPNLVRAVGINGTGCLKLGINYLISVKAVNAAKSIDPAAGAALFLDDQPHEPLESRRITEWDSSCCLFALRDGTVVKIPESPLILPSVTIGGICSILRSRGVPVEEREFTYGELIERSQKNEIVAVCSIGTAGILNRAERIVLVDRDNNIIGEQKSDPDHPLFEELGAARRYYWDIYRGKEQPTPEIKVEKITVR